ncbi:MAG TPA: hypothetical protein PLV68_21510, partial [Ilumatobacteraceae bacterium]|nr:hypothetical protein [Ilumatobacteraceae bacterium]
GPHTMRELAGAATAAIYGERGDPSTALHCADLSEQIVTSVKRRQSLPQRILNLIDPRRVAQLQP